MSTYYDKVIATMRATVEGWQPWGSEPDPTLVLHEAINTIEGLVKAYLGERALTDDAADLFDRIIEAGDDDGNVEAVEATEISGWLVRYQKARDDER